MKSLILGIIMQFWILVSIMFIFRPNEHDGSDHTAVCRKSGAARGVLVIGQGLGSLGGRTRGRVEFRKSVVQLDEMYPVLAGIQDHMVFEPPGYLENILSEVEAVVYAGPSGIMERFVGVRQAMSFTYPLVNKSIEQSLENDKFVFRSIHNILHSGLINSTVAKFLSKKVLFVLYLTSVALENSRNPYNISAVYRSETTSRKALEDIQTHIHQYYSDDKTIFVSIPHWSIVEDKNPIISVWGPGVPENFVNPIELVDVCPLLATLLGVRIPQQSVGILPVSFLSVSLEDEAKAIACNTIQLHQRVFSPDNSRYNENISNILCHIQKREYAQSKDLSERLIQIYRAQLYTSGKCLDRFIIFFVIFGLMGWIFVVITESTLALAGFQPFARRSLIIIALLLSLVVLCEIIYTTMAWCHPYTYHMFIHISLLPWFLLSIKCKIIWNWCTSNANVKTLVHIFILILLEEILVISLDGGFTAVFILTIIGTLPLVSQFRQTPFIYLTVWYACCGLVSGLLSVPRDIDVSRRKLLNIASTFWLCYGQSTVFFFDNTQDSTISQVLVFYMAVSTILANAFLLLSIIPPFFYYLSWATFSALILPFFGTKRIGQRLIHLSQAFAPSLLLMSRHLESFASAVLMAFVVCWVFLERSYITSLNGEWCNMRRGMLLALSCIFGYLLSGTLEDNAPIFLLPPFLPLHLYWKEAVPFYGILIFKYMAVFTMVITVYVSLISRKWETDRGFVYGLLLIEMVCLRFLIQLLIPAMDTSDVINKHIFINMSAILYMLSYYFGLMYSTKYVKQELKDLNELTSEL